MSKPTELPSDTDGPEIDFNPDIDPVPAGSPVRFGRLALWVASSSALAVGVMGTVAYGVWFNEDQHFYAEAMENARQTLWMAALTSPTQQTSASDHGALSSAPPARETTVVSIDLAAPASSAMFKHRKAPSPDSTAPKLNTRRPDRASCATSPDRRRPVSRVKSNGNLFTRVGSFFHRVSYRQHGTESQRDIYSRP